MLTYVYFQVSALDKSDAFLLYRPILSTSGFLLENFHMSTWLMLSGSHHSPGLGRSKILSYSKFLASHRRESAVQVLFPYLSFLEVFSFSQSLVHRHRCCSRT